MAMSGIRARPSALNVIPESIVLKAALQIPLLSLPVAGGWGGGGTVGLLRGLGTGLGRGSDPDWNTGGAVGLGLS